MVFITALLNNGDEYLTNCQGGMHTHVQADKHRDREYITRKEERGGGKEGPTTNDLTG